MSNIWERLKRESNKSTYDLSKEINISEEKVKEILSGEREVATKDMDRVVEAFSTPKTNYINSTERALMEKFFMDNDIQDLKKKFGYRTLEELSKAMNIGVSTMYYLRGEKIKAISNNLLTKIYDFFQDDFNKKVVKNKSKKTNVEKIVFSKPFYIKKGDLSKNIIDWYEKTNLKELRMEQNLSAIELLKKLGYIEQYSSIYYAFENKRTSRKTGNWGIVKQLYNYYHGLELFKVYPDEKDISTTNVISNENVGDVLDYNYRGQNNIVEQQIPLTEEIKVETPKWIEEPTIISSSLDNNIKDYYNEMVTREEYDKINDELKRYKFLIDLLMKKENN